MTASPTPSHHNLLALRYGAGNEPEGTAVHPGHRPDAQPPVDPRLQARCLARRHAADAGGGGPVAATSSNLQTWSVVVVEDPEARARCAEWAGNQKHIVECPLFLLFIADLRAECVAASEELPSAGNDTLEMFTVATIDAALAAQNAVLARRASACPQSISAACATARWTWRT